MSTLDLRLLKKRWEERLPLLLDSFTEITSEAAQRRTELPVPLRLDGLRYLSEDVAKILVQRSGASMAKPRIALSLNGLSEISDQSAGHLSKLNGTLSLNGMKHVSRSLASRLASFTGCLQLNGLTTLGEAAAEDLVGDGLYSISLNGLTDVAPDLLQSLEEVRELKLDGLRSVSVQSAAKLGPWMRKHLSLNGLSVLSDNVARCFPRETANSGWLSLNGLTKIADNVASTLSCHQGALCLNGLTEISDTGFEKLTSADILLELDSLESWSERSRTAMNATFNKRYSSYANRCLSFQSCIMDRSTSIGVGEASVARSILQYIATSLPGWSCTDGRNSITKPILQLSPNACGVSQEFRIYIHKERGMLSVEVVADGLYETCDVLHEDFCMSKMHQLGADVSAIARFIHTTIDADLTYAVDNWEFKANDANAAVQKSYGAAVLFQK